MFHAKPMRGLLLFIVLVAFDCFSFETGNVAAGHEIAVQAGLAALQEGGNAADAAVATALMLGVVDGHNSGIGGGCFILLRTASGKFVAIDGREAAPRGAREDMFQKEGTSSTEGAMAVATPGALAAYACLATNYGKLPLSRHLEAAARIAERGFKVSDGYAARVKRVSSVISKFPAATEILFTNGSPIKAGDFLMQKDLAATYRNISKQGVSWFYTGDFAARTDQWMREHGGILAKEDFATYSIRIRQPLRGTYRGYDIIGFPPPSSGGVHVQQILNILENFDLNKLKARDGEWVHLVIEAMKLAFADRAHWLGDPAFAPVPRGLISKEYGRTLAKKISRTKALVVPGHSIPLNPDDVFSKHTTHFSTADKDGNWVACTSTINTEFGSKVVIPGTGVFLNNEMDDFSSQPGVPNHFGLVGSAANAIAPGKRPLSSMSPTIILKNGKPVLSVGAAGGPTIISATLLVIIRHIDFGMSAEQALASYRFHHQWKPDEVILESAAPSSLEKELRVRGHKVRLVEKIAAAQAIQLSDKHFHAVRDARID